MGPRERPRLAALSGSQFESPRLCRGMVTVERTAQLVAGQQRIGKMVEHAQPGGHVAVRHHGPKVNLACRAIAQGLHYRCGTTTMPITEKLLSILLTTLLAFTTACGCTQNWATCHPTLSSMNRHQKTYLSARNYLTTTHPTPVLGFLPSLIAPKTKSNPITTASPPRPQVDALEAAVALDESGRPAVRRLRANGANVRKPAQSSQLSSVADPSP